MLDGLGRRHGALGAGQGGTVLEQPESLGDGTAFRQGGEMGQEGQQGEQTLVLGLA